jgi:hypothetical protein
MWKPNAFMSNPLFMAGLQGMAASTNPNANVGAAWAQGMQGANQYNLQQQQQKQQKQAWDWKVAAHQQQMQEREALKSVMADPAMQSKLGGYAPLLMQAPGLSAAIIPELIKSQLNNTGLGKLDQSKYTAESWKNYTAAKARGDSDMQARSALVPYRKPTAPKKRPTATDRYGRLVYTDNGQLVLPGADPNDIPVDSTSAFKLRNQALTELKPYREQFESYARVMRALEQDTGAAEIAGIVGFTRFLDPGSVAREGEVELARTSMGAINNLSAQMEKLKAAGGLLAEDAKQSIRDAMGIIMQEVNRHYDIRRGKLVEMGNLMHLKPDITLPAVIPWGRFNFGPAVSPEATGTAGGTGGNSGTGANDADPVLPASVVPLIAGKKT